MNYILLLVGAYLALSKSGKDISVNSTEWESFKSEHGKSFDTQQEDSLRSLIFAHNKHQIDEFNAKESSKAGFELGLNHFADVSDIEMKSYKGLRLPENHEHLLKNSGHANKFVGRILNDNFVEVPDEVDWRKVPGRVTRVKNQGACGACWAFATVGVLEGQEAVRTNKTSFGAGDLTELSEQNLVDCVKDLYGCNGGLMAPALDYIKREGGIEDETSYPYEARNDRCRFNKSKAVFNDDGSAALPTGNELALKKVVAKFGPVAVGIDASDFTFRGYKKGVYHSGLCGNEQENLDHAVLVVGYGTDPTGGDYWIVKNSWGPKWGQDGYVLMARNRNNNCGIATIPTIPTF